MFNKKKCGKCGEKINKNFDFCPYCGNHLSNSNEDWGMLGKNDSVNEFENFPKLMFGGISGNMISKMFGSAIKMLEKELQKEIKSINGNENITQSNFRLMINGREIPLNQNKKQETKHKKEEKIKEIPLITFSQEQQKKFSNLSRKEPETNLRRLSNKVIYELKIPGIKSIKDISITKLENSIEIKAITKNNAYFKLIPINLPIINYNTSKGKLILELEAKD